MQTTLKMTCRLLSLSLLAFSASAAVPSCGGATSGDEGDTDGVTHWLDDCDDDADCGGLECLCGVCTRRCTDASGCALLGESATCTVLQGCAELDDTVCALPYPDGGAACPPEGCAPAECRPMDAASNGDGCTDIVGFAWNGERCEPIECGCQGADCGNLYPFIGPCEQEHLPCSLGLAPRCARSTDCVLDFADCCGGCGGSPIEDLVAILSSTRETYRARACEPDEGCPDCLSSISPEALALCVGLECRAVDTEPVTRCTVDADCHMRYRDCCECDGLPTASNVIAVSDLAGYERLACADGFSCATCDSEYPLDMTAACVEGHCAVVPSAQASVGGDLVQTRCTEVCASEGAWCAIGDESAAECTGNCIADVSSRSAECQVAYLPLLACMQQVFVEAGCAYYVIRELMNTCPNEVQAFLGACDVGEHSLSSVVRPTLVCQGDSVVTTATDSCRVEISSCADGNDYAVECAVRPGGIDLQCSCLVGGAEVHTFVSGGTDIAAFCTDDIGLDYCNFPFLDTGG